MDEGPEERQLNLQMDAAQLAGVYANYAAVSFSDYEFTITFARIEHELDERAGEIPGAVVGRVNMSSKLVQELIDALQDSWSRWSSREGIRNLPETNRPD